MASTKSFKYIRLEEALKTIDNCVKCTTRVESVDLREACGRFLAEDVVSKTDLPPHDVAHFDGYALRSIDVASASPKSPIKLRIKTKVYPSTPKVEVIGPGEAAYITTGSLMPLNSDGILPVEAAIVDGEYLEVKYTVKPGEHVVKAGSDVRRGEVVLKRGHRLRAQDLSLLALIGYGRVKVLSRLKVGILPVGDELTDEYGEIKPGRVPCSHVLMVSCFVVKDCGEPMYLGVVPDNVDLIVEAIEKAASACDMIITISGASKGEKDLVDHAISRIDGSEIMFHGVMIRPGRQTGFAMVHGKPMIMLPGLSHSTIVGYQLIARRVMYRLMGLESIEMPMKASLACDFKLPPPKGFKKVVFVKIEEEANSYVAWPIVGDTALMSIPVKAHGYIVFDEGVDEVKRGRIVNVHLLL
ncbi:MAG: molybdopterin molybdotransferase MoeA [Candidatus Nezhaarchaeota archaeon]|nr:molybdopterin molybdotransferase MoeA [Candidatus Nezhaarchaeota archaeon]MCX8142283.1 molybdopterin molybdotransferase MoeA [Candidatus Nezhaarchaeota archaeon]MDW8050744.1 molybdopterin molybdotransferase MoeA [Nitrososphaerota archaeon]